MNKTHTSQKCFKDLFKDLTVFSRKNTFFNTYSYTETVL